MLEGENRFFRAWTEAVLRYRFVVLLLVAAATAFFVGQIVNELTIDTSTRYFSAGTKVNEVLDEYREEFGRDDYYLVMIEGDVFTMPFLEKVRTLHEALEGFKPELTTEIVTDEAPAEADAAEPAEEDEWGDDDWGDDGGDEWAGEEGGSLIEEVTSLLNVRQTIGESDGIRVRGLMETFPTESEVPALKAKVLADSNLVGQVVGAEGRHAVVLVRTAIIGDDASAEVQTLLTDFVSQYSTPDFEVAVTGMPSLNRELRNSLMNDMLKLIRLAFAIMAVLLFALFRHPLGVIGPLVVVALAASWTLGAMAATGTPVTLITNIIPAFLACVGLGDSVHVQSVYKDARARGVKNHEAIVQAVGSTGMPIVFTTLTTAAGLLSFKFSTTQAIQEMGMASAWGVTVALLHSVLILPIFLSFIKDGKLGKSASKGARKRDLFDALLASCTALSSTPTRRVRTLLGGVVVVIIAAVGLSRLEVYHNPLAWIQDDQPVKVNLNAFDEHVGGTASVALMITANGELGVKDRALLVGLEKLAAHIREFRHPRTGETIVTGVQSLVDIVKETNRALHAGDDAHYVLPATQRGVSDALLLFENAGPDDLRRMVIADLSKSHMSIRVRWMDATSYIPFIEYLEAGIAEHIPNTAEVNATGGVYSIVSVVGVLIYDLLRSFGVALIAVTLMMIALLKSLKMGAVAMVPNLVPLGMVMGFMGFSHIPLDMANLLIASIVIGVAVDATIHYLFQFQVRHQAGEHVETAIQHTLDHAGRAIVSTSLILTLGFSAYLWSSMANIQRFGLLVGTACIFALFTNLILVPAFLRGMYGEEDAHAEDPAA